MRETLDHILYTVQCYQTSVSDLVQVSFPAEISLD